MSTCWPSLCLVLAGALSATNAWGAEAVGRVTYINSDHTRLMLDNSRMYDLTGNTQSTRAAVGNRVELILGGPESKEVEAIKVLS